MSSTNFLIETVTMTSVPSGNYLIETVSMTKTEHNTSDTSDTTTKLWERKDNNRLVSNN